jgi:hypothetical protein
MERNGSACVLTTDNTIDAHEEITESLSMQCVWGGDTKTRLLVLVHVEEKHSRVNSTLLMSGAALPHSLSVYKEMDRYMLHVSHDRVGGIHATNAVLGIQGDRNLVGRINEKARYLLSLGTVEGHESWYGW